MSYTRGCAIEEIRDRINSAVDSHLRFRRAETTRALNITETPIHYDASKYMYETALRLNIQEVDVHVYAVRSPKCLTLSLESALSLAREKKINKHTERALRLILDNLHSSGFSY